MRYLGAIATSMPIFLIAVTWGVAGLPIWWLALALPFGALGTAVGRYMSGVLARHLLHGEGHFLLRQRAPGGVWFFIGIGLFGVAALYLLPTVFFGRTTGTLVLRCGAVVFVTFSTAVFALIGVHVMRLERSTGKRVNMWPDGFFLDE